MSDRDRSSSRFSYSTRPPSSFLPNIILHAIIFPGRLLLDLAACTSAAPAPPHCLLRRADAHNNFLRGKGARTRARTRAPGGEKGARWGRDAGWQAEARSSPSSFDRHERDCGSHHAGSHNSSGISRQQTLCFNCLNYTNIEPSIYH